MNSLMADKRKNPSNLRKAQTPKNPHPFRTRAHQIRDMYGVVIRYRFQLVNFDTGEVLVSDRLSLKNLLGGLQHLITRNIYEGHRLRIIISSHYAKDTEIISDEEYDRLVKQGKIVEQGKAD